MGRRSSHSPGELRHLILQSAREIVEKSGIKALSARAIAKNVGYSPGTLYNVFKNLDELLLTIEAALLEEALAELKAIPAGAQSGAHLRALSDSYISFALRNKQLWNLLLQHSPKPNKLYASPIDDNFNAIISLLAAAIRPSMSHAREPEIRQMAQAMWASIHGISVIAVADKIGAMPEEAAQSCVSAVVDCFLSKLGQKTG